MLGICYGMQAMVQVLGGRVEGAEAGEFGRTPLCSLTAGAVSCPGFPTSSSAG